MSRVKEGQRMCAVWRVLGFGLDEQKKKIHSPRSLQTLVRVSVIEGLRIDLNYRCCL